MNSSFLKKFINRMTARSSDVKILGSILVVAIILAAAIFRFYGLGTAEIFHDEGFYAFRSIGYIDYLQNADQTTPMQWFSKTALPWWTNFSFHDHPPVFFLIQHLSTAILGDTLFSVRLPSVLAGLLAVWFIYLITRKIFENNEWAGLLAALLLAVNHIHIWISRSSLMESTLIALILLNIYIFLCLCCPPEGGLSMREKDRKKYWFLFGLTLGLAFLTKYTAAFLLPAYFIFLLVCRRNILKEKWLYFSPGLVARLFSPVVINKYNIYK